MASNPKHLRRPALACEIAADRVLAGRAADAGRMVEVSSARELARGEGLAACEAVSIYSLGIARWLLGDLAGAEALLIESVSGAIMTTAATAVPLASSCWQADTRSSRSW